MKTTLSVIGMLLLGRNTGNLAQRFELHLFALIPMLMLAASGGASDSLISHMSKTGQSVPDYLSAIHVVGDVAGIAAISLGAYVFVVCLALVIAGASAGTRTPAPTKAPDA